VPEIYRAAVAFALAADAVTVMTVHPQQAMACSSDCKP
jgi:hypothetical protein